MSDCSDWLDLEIKFTRQNIKFMKKIVIAMMCIFGMNTGFILYDGFALFNGHVISSAISFGCFVTNWFLSLFFLFDAVMDHTLGKRNLNRLEGFRDESLNLLGKEAMKNN